MNKTLIQEATIIDNGRRFIGDLLIHGEYIEAIVEHPESIHPTTEMEIIDASGFILIPGVIDDQVHFRDPGLTHKGDIASESRAAVAGGVTSFMDMPNTKPQTTTVQAWKDKMSLGAEKSRANYGFYFGATNDNTAEIEAMDWTKTPGLKVFMGSSTGNMLVDKTAALEKIFSLHDVLIATHCEKEEIIQQNKAFYIKKYGEDLPISFHNKIRNDEACYASSLQAKELADRLGTKLHILHLSSAKEMELFSSKPLNEKHITAEVCVHHLWFSEEDYQRFGNRIKWNPAIKTKADREALLSAVKNDKIDIVATDHAPHLPEEKEGSCLVAASGGPLVQHSLQAMLELAKQGYFDYEKVVQKMCNAPADLFRIQNRGYLRPGFYADLVLINPKAPYKVSKENLLYRCGWSPFEGVTFSHTIVSTWVNGSLVFNKNEVNDSIRGKALTFYR